MLSREEIIERLEDIEIEKLELLEELEIRDEEVVLIERVDTGPLLTFPQHRIL